MYAKAEATSAQDRFCELNSRTRSAPSAPVVHVLDDDEGLRASITDLLHSMGYEVQGYGSTDEFIGVGADHTPGCLLLDVRLPGVGGLEFQAQLAESHVQLPIVFMTGYADVKMSVQGMKAGAIDFLEKPFREQDLLDAVAAALASAESKPGLAGAHEQLEQRYTTLSPREREVMTLVAAGLMNKQVAGRLSISEVTVKIHRSAAMRKMGARSLAQLARMAEVMGIEL